MKTLVMIPTYDESQNIAGLVSALLDLRVPGLEVVVLDDQSPDGTAGIVEGLAREDSRVHLVRRAPPFGRGHAGRDGYLFALTHGADYLVEMDGDLSHDPKHLPALLKAMEHCDIAVGSRLVPGGSDDDRPKPRQWLTLAANLYARLLLSLPLRDTNSGYRCFSRKALETVEPGTLRSAGPSILHEALFRAARRGLKIAEVPIEFVDRKKGESKLNLRRLAAGYFWILKLRLFGG